MKIAELLKLPSCSVWPRHSEQQRRSLFGKVHRADHAGQIRHMDLRSSEGGLEMENNQYSDILTNAMSGDMLVVPMVYGSHFGEVMRMSVTTLSSPPESKTLDYGDLNQTESSMQELRESERYKHDFAHFGCDESQILALGSTVCSLLQVQLPSQEEWNCSTPSLEGQASSGSIPSNVRLSYRLSTIRSLTCSITMICRGTQKGREGHMLRLRM